MTYTLIFDGDLLVYPVCASQEVDVEWEPNLHTLHSDGDQCVALVNAKVRECMAAVAKHEGMRPDMDYLYKMCFSGASNYRKGLYPDYKANRVGMRKPLAYQAVVQHFMQRGSGVVVDHLEGDDLVGIYGSLDGTIMVSADKDLRGVPGLLLDPRHLELGVQVVTIESATRHHLFQTLTGDRTDGYAGCPGVGPVKANAILDESCTWEAVVAAYKDAGLTEEDALVQAQLAYILRDRASLTSPTLWQPSPSDSPKPPTLLQSPSSGASPAAVLPKAKGKKKPATDR